MPRNKALNWQRTLAALIFAPVLMAQAPSPDAVRSHYRAYEVALAANNLAVAETEAAQALEVSVARDGQGGSTAVLAANLAKLRLARGEVAQAYAPALQAYTIAFANLQSGVDPLLSRLLLGRAELTDEHAETAKVMLPDALQDALSRPDLNGDAYTAAAEFGYWLSERGDYDASASAWSVAVRLATAAPGDHVYALAHAKLGEGVAQLLMAMQAQRSRQLRPGATVSMPTWHNFIQADQALAESQTMLRQIAHVASPDGGVTVAQTDYAAALAWRSLLRAYLSSAEHMRLRLPGGGEALPADVGNSLELAGVDSGTAACALMLRAQPRPHFPAAAWAAYSVGAVVLRLVTDDTGRTIDTRVMVAVPDRWFEGAVMAVAPQWRLEPAANSPPSCRPASSVTFVPVRFSFR